MNQLSFKKRIGLLVGVSLLGMVLVACLAMVQIAHRIEDGKRGEVVDAVQAMHAVVTGFQAQAAAGKMSEADAQKAAKDAVRLARYGGEDGKANYLYIFTTDGGGVAHPFKPEWEKDPSLIGKVIDLQGTDIIKQLVDNLAASPDGRAFALNYFPRPGSTEAVPKLHYVARVPGWNWMVGSGLYMDDVSAAVHRALLVNGSAVLGLLLLLGGTGWLVAKSVLRQIGGEPSTAIDAMSEVALGNLAVDLGTPPAGSVMHGLALTVESLRRTVSALRQSADSITTASSEIAVGNLDLSHRTEQTASNLQQTASSMTQLTGTVRQSADAASQANQLASSASSVASRGGQVVSQVVTTMDEINASSKRIADIIGTIDGIAFQTNILALNAAVEAARAGEQGRGFAVVAGEVRSLAQRSAEAAKEIKSLIGTSVDRVEAGARLVQDAGTTMSEIVASVQRVSDIIGEITAASSEQSSGIGQINQAVTQLDQMTQQNAALVEESAAAAESLKDQAHRLSDVVAGFRMESGVAATDWQRPPVAPAVAPTHAAPTRRAAPAAPPSATPFRAASSKPMARGKIAAAPAAAGTTRSPIAKAPVRPAQAATESAAVKPAPAVRATAVDQDHGDWETF